MKYQDYYKVLGVERSADAGEVKGAYRRLARKYHPDVSHEPDAEARFKEIGEAYEVLKDPDKRAAYDNLGAQWQAGQDFTPPPGWDGAFNLNQAFWRIVVRLQRLLRFTVRRPSQRPPLRAWISLGSAGSESR